MGRSQRLGSSSSVVMMTSISQRSESGKSGISSSYSAASSSTLGGGFNNSLSLQGGSSAAAAEYNISTLQANDASHNFSQLLTELQQSSSSHIGGDTTTTTTTTTKQSVRLSACITALIETAIEKRSSSSSSSVREEGVPVSPNEIFVVTISALTSLQLTLEAKTTKQSDNESSSSSSSSTIEEHSTIIETTAIPLLTILQRLLPYVSHHSNNNGALYISSFGILSRLVRMFIVLGYALPATAAVAAVAGGNSGGKKQKRKGKLGGGGVTGSNALLRQLLKVSTTVLLVTPISISASSNSTSTNNTNIGVPEKDIGKFLHTTILHLVNDSRPKVRKAAWGSLMEIIIVASSSSSLSSSGELSTNIIMGDGGGGTDGDDNSMMAEIQKRVQSQRQVVADFIWEYCHAILSSSSSSSSSSGSSSSGGGNNNDDKTTKLIHVLRFLSVALPYGDDIRIRIKFGELCLQLMGGDNDGTTNNNNKKKNKGGGFGFGLDVVKEVLVTLLSCLERTEVEQEQMEHSALRGGGASSAAKGDDEISKFAARSLAFLLQHRPNANAASSTAAHGGSEDDVNVIYGRCLLACMERMLGGGDNKTDDNEKEIDEVVVPASKLLAMKLLPNVMTSMLHLCEAHADSGGNDGNLTDKNSNGSTSCGSEFNQFISRMIPIITSFINEDDDNNAKLHRIALEVLPQCIPILESALSIKYRNAWGSILSGGYSTFITTLAHILLVRRQSSGSSSSELEDTLQSYIQTLVKSLLRLHDDIAKGDNLARTAVEYAMSTIIRGVGVELFMSVVEFVNDDDDDDGVIKAQKKKQKSATGGGGIRDDRAWLLPLMKQGTVTAINTSDDGITLKTHLSFFQTNVLSLARRCDAASADGHRTMAEISIQKARVVESWSLFPSFCVCPLDMKENFSMVAKIVVKALGDYERYPKLIPIVCGGLKSLTIGVMDRANDKSSQTATEDYDDLSNVSTKILPSLFKLVETLNQSSSSQRMDEMEIDSKEAQSKSQQNINLVEAVTDAIGQLAQICPRDFLQTLFKKVIQRLLMATTEIAEASSDDKAAKEVNTNHMASLLGLGQALVASGSLDDTSLSLLYRAVRPLVRTDEHDPRVQKRAYKVLAEICDRHKDFVTSPDRLSEMIELITDSLLTCQVSARHMRLKCMTHIVEGFDSSNSDHMAVIPKIMGEVLLCLKDSNAKTRESAYQLLLAMAVARDDITDYFSIVLAALGAQTTHMRSAAVMALSRLTFEYAREDDTVQELLPNVLQTVAVLFDDSSREVTKSVIGFVRVSVAAMTAEQLEPLLPEVVGGIMKYNKGKDRFRAKIKIILKKLVRVYGYEVIAPLVPEEHTRLITHMRKLSERAARRKAAGLQDGRSIVAGRNFDDMMESDEDDSDDGRTFMTGVTGFTRMTAMSGKTTKRSAMDRSVKSGARSTMTGMSTKSNKGPRIKAELKGEILDMLDSSKMARSVRFADVDMKDDRDFSDDEDGDMQFDNQGRIIISDGMPKGGSQTSAAVEHYDSDDDENADLKAGGKRRRISKFESVKLAKADAGGKGKKQKLKKDAPTSLGSAYKSKKAGGDVKKKGQQYEPYAYVPLNAKDYTKKNRSKAVSKMGTVVRSTKRKRN